MRENTGSRTVATVNIINGTASDEAIWTPEQADMAEWHMQGMIDSHLAMGRELEENTEVWEYDLPGLFVLVLVLDGEAATFVSVVDDDLARVHTALRTGRELSIRYVKPSGEVSRRRVRPQSLFISKAGQEVLRAEDDRRDGEVRSFRWDRVTATTLHRSVRRSAPSKAALAESFTAAVAAPETATEQPSRRVRHTRHGYTGWTVPGSRVFTPSGWSVTVELDDPAATPSGTTNASEAELEELEELASA